MRREGENRMAVANVESLSPESIGRSSTPTLTPQRLRSMLVNKTREVRKLRSLLTRLSNPTKQTSTAQQQADHRASATATASLRERVSSLTTTLQKTKRRLSASQACQLESHRKIEAAIVRIRRVRWGHSCTLAVQDVLDLLQGALVVPTTSSNARLGRRHSMSGPGAAVVGEDAGAWANICREKQQNMEKLEFEQMEQFVDAQTRVEELEDTVKSLTAQLDGLRKKAMDTKMHREAPQNQLRLKDDRIRRLETQLEDMERQNSLLKQRAQNAEAGRVDAFMCLATAKDRLCEAHAELLRQQDSFKSVQHDYIAVLQQLELAADANRQLMQQLGVHQSANQTLQTENRSLIPLQTVRPVGAAVSKLALELRLEQAKGPASGSDDDFSSKVGHDGSDSEDEAVIPAMENSAVETCARRIRTVSATHSDNVVSLPTQNCSLSRRRQPGRRVAPAAISPLAPELKLEQSKRLVGESDDEVSSAVRHEGSDSEEEAEADDPMVGNNINETCLRRIGAVWAMHSDDDVSIQSEHSTTDSEDSSHSACEGEETVTDLRQTLRELSSAMGQQVDLKDLGDTVMYKFTVAAAAPPPQHTFVPVHKMFRYARMGE